MSTKFARTQGNANAPPSACNDEWFTPPGIIAALGEFDLDPACGPACPNRTARRHYERDGLDRAWSGRVWLNPPFSNARPWVRRMIEHGNGVLLVFARTDARWFQDAILAAGGVLLIRGRVQFERPGGGAGRCPLGCTLLGFGEANQAAIMHSGIDGVWLSACRLHQPSPLK